MRCTGRDGNAVAGLDGEFLITQRHQAITLSDVINLFADRMLMQERGDASRNKGFGQTLFVHGMQRRMQQLADFRTILGDVGRCLVQRRFKTHFPPQG